MSRLWMDAENVASSSSQSPFPYISSNSRSCSGLGVVCQLFDRAPFILDDLSFSSFSARLFTSRIAASRSLLTVISALFISMSV